MLELGDQKINKSDLSMRMISYLDMEEFRKAATESVDSNYEFLAYGEIFDQINRVSYMIEFSRMMTNTEADHWGIFHRKQLVGHSAFFQGNGPLGTELVGWVRKGFHSQGVGEIGLQRACEIAFNQKGFNYVELKIDQLNIPSRRVAEKTGFIPVLKAQTPDGKVFITYLKINPKVSKIARMYGRRPIDIMNNPASHPLLNYLLSSDSLNYFYAWPFANYKESDPCVSENEFFAYLGLINLTPKEIENFIMSKDWAEGGVYL